MRCECGAVGDSELPEYPAEVGLDRPRTEEEQRADLAVRPALCRESRDLALLSRQVVAGLRGLCPATLATRAELPPGAVGPRRRAKGLERVEGRAQFPARVPSAVGPTQPFAVAETGARFLEDIASYAKELDGVIEGRVEGFGAGEQRPAAEVRAAGFIEMDVGCDLVETNAGLVWSPCADVRLDQVERVGRELLDRVALSFLARCDGGIRTARAQREQTPRVAFERVHLRRGAGVVRRGSMQTLELISVSPARGDLGLPAESHADGCQLPRIPAEPDRFAQCSVGFIPGADIDLDVGQLLERLRDQPGESELPSAVHALAPQRAGLAQVASPPGAVAGEDEGARVAVAGGVVHGAALGGREQLADLRDRSVTGELPGEDIVEQRVVAIARRSTRCAGEVDVRLRVPRGPEDDRCIRQQIAARSESNAKSDDVRVQQGVGAR